MKDLLIGTGNPAKLKAVQSALKPLGIDVKGTKSLDLSLNIVEDGKSAQENARKKSIAYANSSGYTILSIDNALFLDGLAEGEQPGINTRKVPGVAGRATDKQLLDYYVGVIERLGGQTEGRWEYAVCIANSNRRIFEHTFTSPRHFVAKPSEKMIPGYPLESIQIDPGTGKYISEMTKAEQDSFWQQMIGRELCDFVAGVLEKIG